MPMELVSDRDSRFTSAFRKEVARDNGGAEKPNHTMEQLLRAYTDPIGSDWDLHLSACEYDMHAEVPATTGHWRDTFRVDIWGVTMYPVGLVDTCHHSGERHPPNNAAVCRSVEAPS
jgi:hypothetical protein